MTHENAYFLFRFDPTAVTVEKINKKTENSSKLFLCEILIIILFFSLSKRCEILPNNKPTLN